MGIEKPARIAAMVLAAALLAGPAWGASVVFRTIDEDAAARIGKVAFLPFARVGPVGDDAGLAICPLDHRSHLACSVDQAAEAELSRALGRVLPGGSGMLWSGQEEINQARQRVKEKGGGALSPAGPLQIAIGRELGVDAVLFGFVYCYRDRSGAAIASGKPAAIGFSLHLVEVKTQTPVWSLSYRDEQKPLFSNLLEIPLFMKRKGKWITAAEMSDEAARTVNQSLPWNAAAETKTEPKSSRKKP